MSVSFNYESRFGPPSAPINVADFIQDTSQISSLPLQGQEHWHQLAEDVKSAIEQECRVDDLQAPLLEVLSNPRLTAHVLKSHEYSVNAIHETADTSSKKKRKRFKFPEPSEEHPQVTVLQKKLDNIQLKCWPLALDSALFMRGPKYTDQNPFTEPKLSPDPTSISSTEPEAIITMTIHNRLAYKQGVLARNSQHALLSSQTLGDLFECIPCPSNEMPKERYEDNEMVGYEIGDNDVTGSSPGAVICIEGFAYGDGQTEEDYADKLIKHLKTVSSGSPQNLEKAATSMHETTFSSLTLRINEPYWLLHQGNCEHFIVVDQIRLVHPSDPRSGYPLTLQITPPLLDVCRGCNRVPAVWAIVGDMRLGESPCILCDPCWKNMGDPPDGGILVAPLPKHQLGW